MVTTEHGGHAAAPPAANANEGMVVFWHIKTPDTTAARRFYEQLFGWQFNEINYLTFAILNQGRMMGCLVAAQEPSTSPGSVLYVEVTDLPEALRRATELGAEVVAEPLNVMGTRAFADIRDPTGTLIGLWTENWQG
ncbi:VOC family protein [Micromonospora sp. B11E3]|uniref:VOC family protein n=1 Tax=Micromonospora sp. B11E3 TaxID=3153562 RepID=UPI00325E8ABA